ncbi:MAG: S8 family peptidase [Caldilineaceae bacterium]
MRPQSSGVRRHRRGVIIAKLWQLFLVLVLLPGMTPFTAAPPVQAASKIQPALLQMAAEEPDQLINVIIQNIQPDHATAGLVGQLGGKITKELSMINAFAAQIPAKMLPQIAQADNVRWVSLDAPVAKSASEDAVVLREDFSTDTTAWTEFRGWSGQTWQELGESDGPGAGDVALAAFLGGALQGVRLQNGAKGIQGFANLRDAATATLSFAYRRKNWEDAAAAVTVEISTDKGATWTEVTRLTGPATDPDLQLAHYDITAYASANTTVRFVTSANFASSAKLYLDYVQLEYTPKPEAERSGQVTPMKVFLPVVSNNTDAQNSAIAQSNGKPIRSASVSALQSVYDYFDTSLFSNNGGTENWSTNWIENDPASGGSGPSVGRVQLTGGSLRMNDAPDTGGQPSVAREANLSGAGSAKLHIVFATSYGVDPSDAVVVEVSRDGGATYTLLDTLTGITGATEQTRNYDISRFISANTRVRFRVNANYEMSDEYFDLYVVGIDYDRANSSLSWITLATDGGLWKYLDNGSDQGSTWRQPAFSDSSWATGAGPLGYGNGWEATVIGYGPNSSAKAITTYFRRSVNVVNAANLTDLDIWLLVNDGAVVYLNGNELYRYNLPGGTINYNTYALSSVPSKWLDVTIPTNQLINGENVIAVEVHRALANNTSIAFDLGFGASTTCSDCINTTNLNNAYLKSIGADRLWNSTSRDQGQGVTVAVVDSGIAPHNDILSNVDTSRVLKTVHFGPQTSVDDTNGHGSHVAGIIAGNGARSKGAYMGVAPKANLIDVKVTDDFGRSSTSDVVAGLQWIYNNQAAYNIRVVNLSINSSVAEAYNTSPLDAALEVLWFNGIVVVVSAGNNGSTANGILYPPANDPFVISVGAADDKGTSAITDDTVATFSAYGTTSEGFAKPDLVAPGKNIISLLASDDDNLVLNHAIFAVTSSTSTRYFRMSGTSMASAVTAGAVALLLEDEPNLNPDQVKYRLKATANKTWSGYTALKAGAGYLDVYAAINGTTTQSANTNLPASKLLWTGTTPVNWTSVNWNSVNWNSVNWNSVNWNSVNWNSVNWNSVDWSN